MMQIQLRKVIPDYIEKEKRQNSQIWEQDLTINKGEHLHIVAPSGSGKTSLIHFIYGLRKDYSGTIFYDNAEIKIFLLKIFRHSGKIRSALFFRI
jgi:ABC-type lipoprotein export system ATPase subunit